MRRTSLRQNMIRLNFPLAAMCNVWHLFRSPLHPIALTEARLIMETYDASSWRQASQTHVNRRPHFSRTGFPTLVVPQPTHRLQPCIFRDRDCALYLFFNSKRLENNFTDAASRFRTSRRAPLHTREYLIRSEKVMWSQRVTSTPWFMESSHFLPCHKILYLPATRTPVFVGMRIMKRSSVLAVIDPNSR